MFIIAFTDLYNIKEKVPEMRLSQLKPTDYRTFRGTQNLDLGIPRLTLKIVFICTRPQEIPIVVVCSLYLCSPSRQFLLACKGNKRTKENKGTKRVKGTEGAKRSRDIKDSFSMYRKVKRDKLYFSWTPLRRKCTSIIFYIIINCSGIIVSKYQIGIIWNQKCVVNN